MAPLDGAAQQTLPDALGVRRIVSSNVGPVPGTIVFAIQDDVFSRHAPAVGRYTGRFWVSFTRHEIEAVLPLRTAASHRGDWYRFVIDGLELRSRMVTVRVRLSQATSGLARERYSAFNFYLRNLARGEAIEAESEYVRTDALLQRIMPFGISLGGNRAGSMFTASWLIFRPGTAPSALQTSLCCRLSMTSGCVPRSSSFSGPRRRARCGARSRSRNSR